MKRILIADHYPIIYKGLCCILDSKEYQIVDHVQNAKELIDTIKDQDIDILIIEIDLPQSNGILILRQIKQINPNIKILIYTGQSEKIYALNSIKSGAVGYLPKTASIETIKNAIRRVSQGGIYLNEQISKELTQVRPNKDIRKLGKHQKLSTRELEVLNLLSNGRRNKDIASALDINEKTVSTYKTRLLKKLNVTNIVDLIHQSKLLNIIN